MNFGTLLDKLIALVIVILLLSLIVQTVQSTAKKLLKIKSRQIEDSLLDLFQNALGQPPASRTGPWALLDASPVLQTLSSAVGSFALGVPRLVGRLWRKTPLAVPAPGTAERLRAEVLASFGQLGRFAQSGRPMLDSLAKDDLLRVLSRLEPKYLLGDDEATTFLGKLKSAVDAVVTLGGDLEAIAGDAALRGEASAKFNAFRAVLTPLVTDCQAMLAGTPPALKTGVLAHDLFALRQIQPQAALDLLASVQGHVQTDLVAAKTPAEIEVLQGLSQRLAKIAGDFAALHARFDAVTTAMRARLDGMERWFDTVMQSFDERFARSMKTWGLVIAFTVVVLFNANFFHIYDSISNQEDVRNRVIAEREHVQQRARQGDAAPSPSPSPAQTDPTHVKPADSAPSPSPSPSSSPGQSDVIPGQGNISSLIQNGADGVSQEATIYKDLGFQPISRSQLQQWWAQVGTTGWFFKALSLLFGWFLTTLLLSAGAPFWEDTLESLFGLKNLLRKSSDTKNVEERSGAGQPKP